MKDDKAWDRIVDAVDQKFGLKEHGRTKRHIEDAPDLTEHVSFVIFEREGEVFKLERVQGPAIVDRRTMGARRAGAVTRIENVYDTSETSFRTDMFRKRGEDWDAIDPTALSL
ncbi:MAG TPA: hypothetical protein VMS08_03235 [Candidatus Saccharimonadia bacterium]|nr:hypothetical protein [Candidatus Saccharimonadia bacterium]